jgi:hypothetical protein
MKTTNRKTKFNLLLTLSSSLLALSLNAQISRSSLDTNIQNSYPNNTSGIITPYNLRNVDSNLIYSAVTKLDDTSYTQLFDTVSYFYEGQNVLYGADSIYRCKVASHHGHWNSSHFRFIQTFGGLTGTGLGTPVNTTTPVAWVKVWYASVAYWIPLYQ